MAKKGSIDLFHRLNKGSLKMSHILNPRIMSAILHDKWDFANMLRILSGEIILD